MKKPKIQRTLDKEAVNRVEKNEIVELDAEAVSLVKWYAQRHGRDARDIVSGIVAGALSRLRERSDETTGECSDATAVVLEQDVVAAWRRTSDTDRIFREVYRGGA